MTFKSQRAVARFSLALFVTFAMVVALAPGISLGGMLPAALQTTNSASPSGSGSSSGSPSATPSSTASPSPTGPAIQFLNPSGHSNIVSTKDDGTNNTYHLVAATRALPSNALVEFKYQSGTGNEVSIGIATRVGTTDTFQLQWAVGSLPDGTYTLKAILYSGTIELARDEEEAVVNNEDDTLPSPPDPQAETVEITAPANGAAAGFFQPAGQPTAHTIVEVTSSAALDPPSLSQGTANVRVFYTTSAPGTEPEWVECGTEARAEDGNKIECTIAEPEEGATAATPEQVTALAAVADGELSGLPENVTPGSGDAHRVFPYVQVPTNITLAPTAQTGKPAGTCADPVLATTLDQNGRPITGLNVDVHAKGPSDGLQFDDPDENSSTHQPPDKAHTAPELTRDCEGDAEGEAEQGQHELSPGNPDIKHVESVSGTTEDGTFQFQLYSPDAGRSDFAVFADVDDDDQWCAEEESALGSVTFSQSASPSPSPSGSASSSPSSSPSGSSSPSASTTPSGSPTPAEPTTLGPDTASCPRTSPSPSATGEANRSITLATSKAKVAYEGGVTLSGQISSEDASCVNNEVVEIVRRVHGTQRFRDFRTTATDGSGAFDIQAVVRKNADYQAIAPENGACDEAMSSALTVRAKVRISIAANDRTPARGSEIDILGKVTPKHRGDRVVLQRKKGGRWVKVATERLDRRSTYRFEIEAGFGTRVFRVRWKAQDDDHASAKSRKLRVRSHR